MSRRDAIAAKIAARSHYEDRGYKDPETGLPSLCRIWDGPTSGGEDTTRGHGYGRMNLDGATVAVHIAAWVNENGLIPPKKQLDHLCHQRDCCEETHLKLRTHKQNQRNKKPKVGVHGEVGPEGVRGGRWSSGVNFEAASHDAVISDGAVMRGSLAYRPEYATGAMPWPTPAIIGHDIPADRLPQAAAEVQDE